MTTPADRFLRILPAFVADFLLVIVAWILAYQFYFRFSLPVFPDPDYRDQMLALLPWVALLQVGALSAAGSYRTSARMSLGRNLGFAAGAVWLMFVFWLVVAVIANGSQSFFQLPVMDAPGGGFEIVPIRAALLFLHSVLACALLCGVRAAMLAYNRVSIEDVAPPESGAGRPPSAESMRREVYPAGPANEVLRPSRLGIELDADRLNDYASFLRKRLATDPGDLQPSHFPHLADATVMITGAGGSLGRALAMRLATSGVQRLVLVGRGASALELTRREIAALPARAFGDVSAPDVVPRIADVTDRDAMESLFTAYHPQVVFHLAAVSSAQLVEVQPEEGVRTNIIGTATVAWLAHAARVKRFVLVSCGRAASPVSVLGASKRVAERGMFALASQSGTSFCAVRLPSLVNNSSLLRGLAEDALRGGPLRIPHPSASGCWLDAQRAAALVHVAAREDAAGRLLLAECPESRPLTELAGELASHVALMGKRKPSVEVRGLEPGERITETPPSELPGAVPFNVPGLRFIDPREDLDWARFSQFIAELRELAAAGHAIPLLDALRHLAPEFHHPGLAEQSDQEALKPAFAQALAASAAAQASLAMAGADDDNEQPAALRGLEERENIVATSTPVPLLGEPPEQATREEQPREDESSETVDAFIKPKDFEASEAEAIAADDAGVVPEDPAVQDAIETTEAPPPAKITAPDDEAKLFADLIDDAPPEQDEEPEEPAYEQASLFPDEEVAAGEESPEGELLDGADAESPEAEAEPEQEIEFHPEDPIEEDEDDFLLDSAEEDEGDLVREDGVELSEIADFADLVEEGDEEIPVDDSMPEIGQGLTPDIEGGDAPAPPSESHREELLVNEITGDSLGLAGGVSLNELLSSKELAMTQAASQQSNPCVFFAHVEGASEKEILDLLAHLGEVNGGAPHVVLNGATSVSNLPAEYSSTVSFLPANIQGEAAKFNKALEACPAGSLLVTTAPDIRFTADFVGRMGQAVQKAPDAGLFYMDHITEVNGAERLETLHDHDGCPHERFDFGRVKAYVADAIRGIGGFDESLQHAWEYDAQLKLMEKGPILRVPEPAYRVIEVKADESKSGALYSPGAGPLGGFSYVFYPEDVEREVTTVFEKALKRWGAWLDHPTVEVPQPKTKPEVMGSVIIPVLNRVKFIGNAIEKVVNGTYDDFEVIVIDNGSTDGTIDVVNEWAAKDPRVRIVHGTGGSIASALNEGIKAARGKYICQLDSDDQYDPTTLEKMLGHLESHPKCGLAISYYRLMDENAVVIDDVDPITHGGYTRNQILRRDGAGALRVFPKAVLEEFGYYDEVNYGNFGEDYDMVVKTGEKYDVDRVHEVLYYYRRHSDNTDVIRDPEMKYKNKNRARQEALRRRIKINRELAGK